MNELEQDQMLEVIKTILEDENALKPCSFITEHVVPLLFSMFKSNDEVPVPRPNTPSNPPTSPSPPSPPNSPNPALTP